MGCDYEDIERNRLSEDCTDYLWDGKVIFENGVFSKILFNGGYIDSFTKMESLPYRPSVSITDGEYKNQLEDYIRAKKTREIGFKFYNKDHLGNNREVIDKDGVVCQRNDFYPYGTPFISLHRTINECNQPYKYNGKEFDMMHGLNTYDYGARQYSPILPMWDRVDPLAEKYYNVSPYAYCMNDPVNYVDPDGKEKKEYLTADEVRNSDYYLYPENTPGVLNVWAHGVKETRKSDYAWAIKVNNKNIKDVDGFIKNVLRDSKEWKNSDGKNLIIVLHSCSSSELAKKMSGDEKFKGRNITFIAPIASLVTNKKGSRVNDKMYLKNNEVVKRESGKWLLFRDGRKIGTLPNKAQPGMVGRRETKQYGEEKELFEKKGGNNNE